MNESIHKYFKIGTIQWMSHPPADRDVLTSIHQIACDDFFDAIEVSKFDCDEARAKAKKMLDEGHMTVCYGAQPRLLGPKLNPNDIDEEGRLVIIDEQGRENRLCSGEISLGSSQFTE